MRQLGPAPFGLVAMALAIMAAFSAVGDAGVGSSLVSDRQTSPSRVGAAVLTALALGSATAVIAAACTPLVVLAYGEPRLVEVWLALALSLGITPLASVPYALAQRSERFTIIAALPVVTNLAAVSLGVGLATLRHDHWPILLRQVSGVALNVLAFWLVLRPRLARPERRDLSEVFRFGRGVLGFDLLNVFSRNADKFVVGRWLGEHAVGLYALAYRVLTLPLNQISSIAGSIAYPRLSATGERHPERVARELGEVMGNVATIATPLCLCAALAPREIILTFFGAAWLEAEVPFRILALVGVYQAPSMLAWIAYKVSRRTEAMARWALISSPLIVASFFLGLPWGPGGVAAAYALMSLALTLPLMVSAARVLESRLADLVSPVLAGLGRGVVATALPAAIYGVSRAAGASPIVTVAAVAVAGAAVEARILWGMRRTRPAAA